MPESLSFLIDVLGYVVLGAIQGLTEILPISSSAHLGLTRRFLEDLVGFQGFTFEAAVFLHLGTFAAILSWYQRDVVHIWRALLGSLLRRAPPGAAAGGSGPHARLMLLSLALTALVGLGLRAASRAIFDHPLALAALLIVNGLFLGLIARRPAGHKRQGDLRARDYVLIGLCQGVSVVPGISRFGMTLSAGLLCGLSWYEALKLAFLLSLPTVLGASMLVALELQASGALAAPNWLGLLAGTLVSAGVGYLAIRLLLHHGLHMRGKLYAIAGYCVITGLFAGVYFAWLG